MVATSRKIIKENHIGKRQLFVSYSYVTHTQIRVHSHLYSGLGQSDLLRQSLSREHVRVVGPLELCGAETSRVSDAACQTPRVSPACQSPRVSRCVSVAAC